MLEMLATLIAGILGLIKKGDLQQASIALDNAYMDFLKEDASLFRNLPRDELSEKLLREHNYTRDHLKILSELFYAEAELRLAEGDRESSLDYLGKAYDLLGFVVKEASAFSLENQARLAEIQQKMNFQTS
jgi:hypothetical protein